MPTEFFSQDHEMPEPASTRPELEGASNVMSAPFFIEMFAGSARVTACIRANGLDSSFGVDHKLQHNAGRVMLVDLTTKQGQKQFWTWVQSANCLGVFAAPPCGTCSRAREIPIVLPNGRSGPPPLRTTAEPNGLPHLRWVDRLRVSMANRLYKFLQEVALFCLDTSRVICIENPLNSLLWLTTFIQPLVRRMQFVAHQACAYGGSRPKATALLHNHSEFNRINQSCPGVSKHHKHKQWGYDVGTCTYATKSEAAYPMALAQAIADACCRIAKAKGWSPAMQTIPPSHSLPFVRATLADQPKASKTGPLVPEFRTVIHVMIPQSQPLPCTPGCHVPADFLNVPAGAKLVKSSPFRITRGEDRVVDNYGSQDAKKQLVFGVYHEPMEFVEVAAKAGHPATWQSPLPEPLQEVVNLNATSSPKQISLKRLAILKDWSVLADKLQEQERVLHESMPKHMQPIVKNKRILLWEALLKEYKYPDLEAVSEMKDGVDLLTKVPPLATMNSGLKPAVRSVDELKAYAASNREAVLNSVRSSGDGFIDGEIVRKTMEEVEAKWLEGPFTELPSGAIVSRRFGVVQMTPSGDRKVRLIDDFSASGVNGCVQTECAPALHSLDVIGALMRELNRVSPHQKWQGKAIDLSAAYRQVCISKDSLWASYIAIHDPVRSKPSYFRMNALPFGAIKSVFSFLRLSHSLWFLGTKGLGLPWTNYFDDYILMSRQEIADVSAACASLLFKLLGWDISKGDKDLPFNEVFKVLGVEVSLTEWGSGKILLTNTARRVEELLAFLRKILKEGMLSTPTALVLRGRMQFARAQVWGRSTRLCLKQVTSHAYEGSGPELSIQTRTALETFARFLEGGKPRVLKAEWEEPMYVYTDASFEPNDDSWPSGIGGVLCDARGRVLKHFSQVLTLSQLEALGLPSRKTVIFEAELLAVVVAVHAWGSILEGRPVLFFIDNNSARDVAISGTARSLIPLCLVGLLLQMEDNFLITSWFSRVPSKSNVADEPSRKDGNLEHLGEPTDVTKSISEILCQLKQATSNLCAPVK